MVIEVMVIRDLSSCTAIRVLAQNWKLRGCRAEAEVQSILLSLAGKNYGTICKFFLCQTQLKFLKGYFCTNKFEYCLPLLSFKYYKPCNITNPVLTFNIRENILTAQREDLQQNLALLNHLKVLGFSSVELRFSLWAFNSANNQVALYRSV